MSQTFVYTVYRSAPTHTSHIAHMAQMLQRNGKCEKLMDSCTMHPYTHNGMATAYMMSDRELGESSVGQTEQSIDLVFV